MTHPTNEAARDLRGRFVVVDAKTADEWRDLLDAALAYEQRAAVELTIEAAQEHLACACGGIEGHLRVRGLSLEADR